MKVSETFFSKFSHDDAITLYTEPDDVVKAFTNLAVDILNNFQTQGKSSLALIGMQHPCYFIFNQKF